VRRPRDQREHVQYMHGNDFVVFTNSLAPERRPGRLAAQQHRGRSDHAPLPRAALLELVETYESRIADGWEIHDDPSLGPSGAT
jgi:hypothetical protein